jgi:hypothetical protein
VTDAQSEWARCKHWIEAARKRSPFPEAMEAIERKIASGDYQFWPGKKGAVITEVADFAGHKTLIAVHGGGNLQEFIDAIEPALCDVAKALGCRFMAGIGREGYKRVWQSRGYTFAWLMMVKEL